MLLLFEVFFEGVAMSQAAAVGLHKDALSQLGLKEDLFSVLGMKPVFFNSWANQVQLIEHLVLFSNVLMVMSAQRGAGKTTFSQFLAQSLPKDISCIPLSAKALALDPEELLRIIGKELKISVNGEYLSDKLDSIYRHARSLGKHWLFVIDDADLLTEDNLRLISELIGLSKDNEAYLHFFLLGHQRLTAKIRELSMQSMNCQSHVLALASLKVEEIRLYLNHCYSHVRGEPAQLPLSERELENLKESSNGNIAYLKVSCCELLNRKYIAKAAPVVTSNVKVQNKWIIMVSGLMLLLIMISFFFGKESSLNFEKRSLRPQVKEQEESYQAINFAHVREEFEKSHRLREMRKEAALAAPALREDEQEVVLEKPIRKPRVSQSSLQKHQVKVPFEKPVVKTQVSENLNSEPSFNEQSAALEAAREKLEENAKPVVLDKVVVMPTLAPKVVEPVKVVKKAIPVKKSQVSVKPATKIAQKPKTKTNTSAKVIQKSADEIKYAIQLIGSSSLDSVKTFVFQRKLQKEVVYYQTKHQGKPWYVAVMGPYSDKGKAKDKLAKLPTSVKKYTPWVRSTKGLGKPKNL